MEFTSELWLFFLFVLILYFMNLSQAKLNTVCVVKNLALTDTETKIRLMELGITPGTKIKVKHKSSLKKTLLIIFASSCFTLKDNLAKGIEVDYA